MQTSGSRQKLFLIVGAVMALAVAVVVAVSLRSEQKSNDLAAIDSPAVVSSTTVALQTATRASADIGDTGDVLPVVNRTLDGPGAFTCAAPGVWHPFPDNAAPILVGEVAPSASCDLDILAMPTGSCTPSCEQVPDEWQVRALGGVSAHRLFVIVVPIQEPRALFYCVQDSVILAPREFDLTATASHACSTEAVVTPTMDTTDIVVVPADTLDIPSAPPPVSADIVSG